MDFVSWIRRAPRASILCFCVIALHLFVLVRISVSGSKIPGPPKKMVVHTKAAAPLQKSVPKAAVSQTAPKPKTKADAREPNPVAAKPAPPKQQVVVKKTAPAKKQQNKPPEPKKLRPKKDSEPTQSKIPEDLLKQLDESIAKIDVKRSEVRGKKRGIKDIETPALGAVEIENGAEAPTEYQDLLVHYLKDSLHLPDYGEVRMELTLHASGTVAKWVVLKTESEKNRKYLEEKLPHLRFPRFGGMLSKQEHTFTLTFCNDI